MDACGDYVQDRTDPLMGSVTDFVISETGHDQIILPFISTLTSAIT